MANINLLPWRENLRVQQKKNYLTMLVAIALGALSLMFGVGAVVDNLINNQNQRNQYIEQQIIVLDGQIKKIKDIKQSKQEIEQRMALIEQLESSRNAVPKVLDELVKLVPPGLSFRSFSRKNNQIEVLGVSESNNRLADFMRHLEDSKVFSSGDLSSIVADTSASDSVSDFKLTFSIHPSVAPDFSRITEEKK
ncbi:MAG: type IV pilus assembly protein PilN [Paraglaciecola sp.]|jgi:type IV pilus assembly protein PilN